MADSSAFDIADKVTIITGGGTGIGAEIAAEFCRRGAKVLITSRTMDHLGPVADGIRNEGARSMRLYATCVRTIRSKPWSTEPWPTGVGSMC